MGVAKIYPEPDLRGKGNKSEAALIAGSGGLAMQRVREARAVLQWAPELVDAVRDGAESLDRAYAIAVDRRN